MKNISREAIQRMVGGVNSVIGGGAGGGGDLAGYATEMWVEDKYVNKEFFSSLFKAYDANGNEVKPNDTATAIDNIKAMFGFWTDFYISALGTGGQQSVDLRLAQLADVNVAGVTNGQVLTYDSTTGKWVASTPQAGTDMATVWANLAASGNQQIDASHLTTALTGYATQTWVTNQGYITASAISDMATKTWVNSQISDMATKTWANGQFLKLSGGTLTGLLKISTGDGITDASGNGMLCYHPTSWTGVTNSQWGVGAIDCKGIIRSNDNPLVHYKGDTSYDIIDASGGTISGTLVLSKTQDASGTADNGPALVVGGTRTHAHLEMDANELMAKGSSTTTAKLYLNSEGGEVELGDNLVLRDGKRIYNSTGSGGSLYIGRSDDAGWVKMSDMCSRQGDTYWKITSNGNSEFANVYSRGYVTALSDERKKNIVSDIALTVEDIAKAPAIRFQWNDRDDKTVFVGSIAQYWQKVLPEVVQSQADDTLSLDYQVAALISSITVSRKVMNHESRLQRLERMFAINEDDIED